MSRIDTIKEVIWSWKLSELTSEQAMQRIADEFVLEEIVKRHKLDETKTNIKYYPDLLKQANDNGFESVYEFIIAVYDQWGSVASVAKYLKRTRVGTLRLMRNLGVPVKLVKGGANNRRHIG